MRIIGLDAARSMAIVFAMSSHVYAEASLSVHTPDHIARLAGFMFQIATPTFILLFGTMLEVIYRPRWTNGPARREVATRLVSRALQCWVLYAVTIFALFLTDEGYSLRFSLATILFMGNSPYTEILKFYAIVLALAPILLWMREKIGLWPLVILALAFHVAWPLLDALPDAQHDLGAPIHIARLIKFLTGFGDLQLAGPSILHGLTLVIAGQCLGRFLTGGSSKGLRTMDLSSYRGFGQRVRGLLIGGGVVALIGGLVLTNEAIDGLVDGSLRKDSHPLYFATGILSATLMTLLFVQLIDIRNVGSADLWTRVTFFGRTSMFTFAWGNIFLYLVGPSPVSASTALIWAAALLGGICAMSFAFDRAARCSPATAAVLKRLRIPTDWLASKFLFPTRRDLPARHL